MSQEVEDQNQKTVLLKKTKSGIKNKDPHAENHTPEETSDYSLKSISSPTTDYTLPRPLAVGNYKSLRIDIPTKDAPTNDFKLNIINDIYKDQFYQKRHYNFIGTEKGERYVLSVLDEPTKESSQNIYPALKTTIKGYQEFKVTVPIEENIPLVDSLASVLSEKETDVYPIYNNVQFANDFVKLEENHPQKVEHMKIGIMYCRKGQVMPSDMFKNGIDDKCSEDFWKFVNNLGKYINLENWEGYRGDMGKTGEAYYEEWKKVEIVYHISPLLNSEGHRRLVGNDLGIIFYLEEGDDTFFDPTHLDKLGTMPQIYCVVQPTGSLYRAAFFSIINIKPYGPPLPIGPFDIYTLKELMLTKMYNGLVMVKYCPPISRLFYVPRKETMDSILSKYPYIPTKKAKKVKDKEFKKTGEKLLVKAIGARYVISKEKAMNCDSYLIISLKEQKEKTKPIKGTTCPVWNADLKFFLTGVDGLYDDLHISCCNHSESLAELKLPLHGVLEKAKKNTEAQWYSFEKKISNAAELMLRFSILAEDTPEEVLPAKKKQGKEKIQKSKQSAMDLPKLDSSKRRLSF